MYKFESIRASRSLQTDMVSQYRGFYTYLQCHAAKRNVVKQRI